MPTIEYDLRYLREGLDLLESYLLSKEIFWNFPVTPPPGEAPYPALTLGGILLSAARLLAYEGGHSLQPVQVTAWSELRSRLDILRRRWHSAWTQKAERSFNARLTQWGNFLEEYRLNPDAHAQRYAYEVRLRVMLDLLAAETSLISSYQHDHLHSLDVILRHYLRVGSFIWNDQLSTGFPQIGYWYLYGQLSMERINSA